MLAILKAEYGGDGRQNDTFQAKDIAQLINTGGVGSATLKSYFGSSDKNAPNSISVKMVSHQIGRMIDTPVVAQDAVDLEGTAFWRSRTMRLRKKPQPDNQAKQRKTAKFYVEVIGDPTYQRTGQANPHEANPRPIAKAKPYEANDAGWDDTYEAIYS